MEYQPFEFFIDLIHKCLKKQRLKREERRAVLLVLQLHIDCDGKELKYSLETYLIIWKGSYKVD